METTKKEPIVITAVNFKQSFENEIKAAVNNYTDEIIKRKHDQLTYLGIPLFEDMQDKSPLARYIRYLSESLNVPYTQPCNQIVLDYLYSYCGSELIWILA